MEDGDRQFVIVTKDFSGLGWAKKLDEEGETVTVATVYDEEDAQLKKGMKQVGKGWLDVVELSEAVKSLKSDNTYWIFTENCFTTVADRLRKEGQKVFGTSKLSERMEHERQYAVDIVKKAGLKCPETHEFSSLDEGIAFLEAHPDKAYVFKPDDGKFNYMTFVPARKEDADANHEVLMWLTHTKEDPGTFILQERIPQEKALEVNCEVWMYEGEPFLANLGLEVKRKNTYDLGEMTGCGGDVIQFIPLDCELVKQTVGKLFPFYKEQKYTGFADVNVIFTKDGTPYFLEVCNRFGYNSHPNMFLALALDGFGTIMADFMDGLVDDMPSRFRTDIGGSLTIFLDHPRPGLHLHLDEKTEEKFYTFDGYKEDKHHLFLTGYSDEVGIFLDHGKTPEAVADKILQQVIGEKVSAPDIYYRMDLGSTDYYNAPVLRYKELKKRRLI